VRSVTLSIPNRRNFPFRFRVYALRLPVTSGEPHAFAVLTRRKLHRTLKIESPHSVVALTGYLA